jgi:PAS domain S-box-containing protein
MFGIPRTSYSGHVDDFRRRVHAEDRRRVWQAAKDAMDGRSPYALEFRVVRDDGAVRWVAAQGQFYYSATGEPRRMLGIAVDITDRKAAEEALHVKDTELAEAQRLARVGSWQWDPATDVVIWSEELYRIAGRDPGLPAVSYQDHAQLYAPGSWNRLRAAVEEALRTGTPYELDLEMIRADGETRWVLARGEAQRDSEGRVVRLRGTLQDISERKAAQDAIASLGRRLIEAQDAERTRIARELHDDIAQRLALTLLALDQRRQTSLTPNERTIERKDDLHRQIEDVFRSVRDLAHQLHSATLNHLGMATAMKGFCAELATQQDVRIDVSIRDIPAGVPEEIAVCLFRVLQEALHNAIKHSHVRHFEVDVSGASGVLFLTVRDSGIGFDPARATQGRGLGLVSMHERLKLVNGELCIDSQHAKGTSVHARVPLGVAVSAT